MALLAMSQRLCTIALACSSVLAQESPRTPVAFTNANIISPDHESVEQGRTVLVSGDRIVAVGSRKEVNVPPDAVVLDCAGQYLVPGLTDAHAHVSGSPLVPTRDDFGEVRSIWPTG